MDTVMDAQQQIRRSVELVRTIKPLLAGEDPKIVAAAFGELVATLIAGHHPDKRAKVRRMLFEMADELVPLVVAEMIEDGRAPKDWQDVDG
jgi:hypothetical protein